MSAEQQAAQFRADVKETYRSGRDRLSQDFFGPALKSAVLYRRSVGFFTTSALLAWSEGLVRLVTGDLRIQLIASPELSEADLNLLRTLQSPEQRAAVYAEIGDRILETVLDFIDQPDDVGRRATVFAWLLASERLELRFAFPDHVEDAGMYHEKVGVVDLAGGGRLAFTGSANETDSGHRRNFESIDVFRDWVPGEDGRVASKVEQFDEAWRGDTPGLSVLRPTPGLLERLRARAPKASPVPTTPPAPALAISLWPHQQDAMDAFLKARHGVLEMATGTGKTRTALAILSRLVGKGDIGTAVICMDGTDLLDQWAEDLRHWLASQGRGWLLYRQYEENRELPEYGLDPHHAILLVSRSQLGRLSRHLAKVSKETALIIHDEVHGLGAPALVESLAGLHASFVWRLGLSATPERAYDDAGNQFIEEAIGPTIYAFPLEEAIRRGVLTEFDYEALPYDLTDEDRRRLKQVYSRQARRAREGRPMSQQEMWTELARVYKTAEEKPLVFAKRLAEDPSIINRCIIFVETREYAVPILETIDAYTHRYRTYYAEDDRNHLVSFAKGEIDCLITCHRISQGIDIQSLNAVVLFASARSRLETIQRIGRCLRTDPMNRTKRARVIDFVRTGAAAGEPSADEDRAAWLEALSSVRREDADAN